MINFQMKFRKFRYVLFALCLVSRTNEIFVDITKKLKEQSIIFVISRYENIYYKIKQLKVNFKKDKLIGGIEFSSA